MTYVSNEHLYIDPNTGVFRNKIGAKTQAKLDRAEAEISYIAITTLVQGSRVQKLVFDTKLLQDVHREIFRDIYTWAGEFRKELTSKGKTTFAHPDFIKPALDDIFQKMSNDNHLGKSFEETVNALADYYGDINAVHPFREGNGRAIRTFMSLLAKKHRCLIAWDKMDADENVHVCESAMKLHMEPMYKMFHQITAVL